MRFGLVNAFILFLCSTTLYVVVYYLYLSFFTDTAVRRRFISVALFVLVFSAFMLGDFRGEVTDFISIASLEDCCHFYVRLKDLLSLPLPSDYTVLSDCYQ